VAGHAPIASGAIPGTLVVRHIDSADAAELDRFFRHHIRCLNRKRFGRGEFGASRRKFVIIDFVKPHKKSARPREMKSG
jgi:hypothetical protein